jgi:ABC-2 type transport system ATP-binding protein
LLNRPQLVILDELTQGLDPSARREVWKAVAQLHAAGTTVLLVTHQLDEAEALCQRVVAMRDGRVLDQGTPAELIARHTSRATVTFELPVGEDLQELQRLPGVDAVSRQDSRIAVGGSRASIAHIGAWLVRRGEPIPADLHVDVPGLEDALLALLDGSRSEGAAS